MEDEKVDLKSPELVGVEIAYSLLSEIEQGGVVDSTHQCLVKFVSPLMPPVAVATMAILCGNAIAQSSSAILMSGQQVVLACCLLHASGFFFPYVFARILLGIDISSAKTISMEVGM
ncbi:putative sodium/metabolite cotransporter BASS1 chloroplastic [Bienertia sinuspersici]